MTGHSGNSYFGKVNEPFTCCDPLFQVYDKNNQIKWKIHTECCQCGIMCRNDCGKCQEVIFPIYSGDKTLFNPNNSEGYVKKCFNGMKEMISDADTFVLEFPVKATPEERLMLIGAVLMVDYSYYEDTGNSNK
jgi:hypothetical protein